MWRSQWVLRSGRGNRRMSEHCKTSSRIKVAKQVVIVEKIPSTATGKILRRRWLKLGRRKKV